MARDISSGESGNVLAKQQRTDINDCAQLQAQRSLYSSCRRDGPSFLCRAGRRDVLASVAPSVHRCDNKDKMCTATEKRRGDTTINSLGAQQFSLAAKGRWGIERCRAGRRRGDDEKKEGGVRSPPLLPSPWSNRPPPRNRGQGRRNRSATWKKTHTKNMIVMQQN